MFLCLSSLSAADWPGFFGPNGNDILVEEKFKADLSKWSQAWTKEIGFGYSAIAISGNMAFAMGHDGGEKESVYCLDVATGKAIWTHTYSGILLDKQHKGGPNATPAIEGDFVYILGKTGQVFCLKKKDGSVVWKNNLKTVSKSKTPTWGYGGSPVIHGDMLLFAGAKAVALNKKTGKLIWLSDDVEKSSRAYIPGYATPVVFTRNRVEYLTFYVGTGLEVLTLKDGKQVARYKVTTKYNMVACSPVVVDGGNKILLSWNPYSALLGFDGQTLKAVWKKKDYIRSLQNNIVKDGVIYGTKGHVRDKRTSLMAVELETGMVLWEEKFKWSQIIAVGESLLCLTIDGNLETVKLSPKKFERLSAIKVLDSINWTKPTYSQGRIFVRNDTGKMICFVLK